jgi:hypothetical protein
MTEESKMRRKKNVLYPVIILFGIVVLFTLAVIFYPAMFESLSSGSTVSKYDGNSQQGTDTARAAAGADGFLAGIYALPSGPGFIAFVLIAMVIVVIVMLKLTLGKKTG